MKLLSSQTLLMALSLAVSVACTPQFNQKDATKKKTSTAAAPVTTTRKLTDAADPYTSGGGALGTSAGFRLSGVNVGYVVKKVDGAATGYKLKGGVNGQLAP